jgi:hypothetical protein
MVRRCTEKPLVVGIAADDTVENNHIGSLDAVRVGGEVVEPPLRATLNVRLA